MKNIIILAFSFLMVFSCGWNYKNSEKWAQLKDEYKFCKIGYNQSPIDVRPDYVFEKKELEFHYNSSEIELEREKFAAKINFLDKNFILLKKKKYWLHSLVFHHPSEHLINSQRHSMEMQVIHKSDDEQFLILAIFLEIGKENSAFKKIINSLSKKSAANKINLSEIVKKDDLIFYYDGSFTTPPCKEGVKWYIMKTPLEISKDQMNQLIKLAIFSKTNARPVQQFHPERY